MSEPDKFHLYCDESCQNAHRYTVIGATLCRPDAASKIRDRLNELIELHGQSRHRELKWTNLKRHKLNLYRDVTSAYFQMMDQRMLRYRCLVIDTTTVNHDLYSDGDHDLGFTKFMFVLLYSFAEMLRSNVHFHAFIDERSTKHPIEIMKYTLNNKCKTHLPAHKQPFQTVRFIKSEESRLIQATDIITGAIAAETNGHHLLPNSSAHKVNLMRHIAACAQLDTLALHKFRWPNFSIWHLDVEKGRSRLSA
jgi:hypothetical protein